MIEYFLLFFISANLLVYFFISIYNYLTAPRANDFNYSLKNNYDISILVPARNEEKNIKDCIISLKNQTYPINEIIVLDDDSSDDTFNIVKKFSEEDSKIKLIRNTTLPEGWLGKNYACWLLSQNAKSKIFIFLDADVRLEKEAINILLKYWENYELKFLSVFPTQKMNKFSEYFITPLMNWFLLTFLPLNFVYKISNPMFSAANGQLIMIDSNIYREIDGHRAVKNHPVEDMALIKKIKEKKLKAMTLLGDNQIFCHMYDNLKQGIEGFSKNFFNGLSLKPALYILFLVYIEFIFFAPFLLVFLYPLQLINIIIILINKILIIKISKQNIFLNIILHPFQQIILFYLGNLSMYKTLKGKLNWKERNLITIKN